MTHLSIAYEAFMVGGLIMFMVWFCLKGDER